MPTRTDLLRVLAVLGLCAAGGCAGEKRVPEPEPQAIGGDVTGDLSPQAFRKVYGTPAFTVRRVDGDRHTAVQGPDLPADAVVDDENLVIVAEGSGDTVDGFRQTARLLAESPHGFPGGAQLTVAVCHWCESTNVIAEHTNRKAQMAGAARLQDMLQVHRRRHGRRGHVSLIGFSAGSRVIEFAFAGDVRPGEAGHPEARALVDHVVYLGSSVSSEDATPYDAIRGRFLNFVNDRDTHFGDRAAYVAPAGESPRLLELVEQATLLRRPLFGASVRGFRRLPTLTSAAQFDALDEAARHDAGRDVVRAFREVNVPVPTTLIPYNLFGEPVPNDDLDDYLNLAPNHYILVGRGPGGAVDSAAFGQYREPAEEFVHEQVSSAALRGRVYRFDLKSRPRGANPLKGVPLPLPWAIMRPETKSEQEPESPPEPPPPANGKADEVPAGKTAD